MYLIIFGWILLNSILSQGLKMLFGEIWIFVKQSQKVI